MGSLGQKKGSEWRVNNKQWGGVCWSGQRGSTVMGNGVCVRKFIGWIIIFNFLKGWLADFATLLH